MKNLVEKIKEFGLNLGRKVALPIVLATTVSLGSLYAAPANQSAQQVQQVQNMQEKKTEIVAPPAKNQKLDININSNYEFPTKVNNNESVFSDTEFPGEYHGKGSNAINRIFEEVTSGKISNYLQFISQVKQLPPEEKVILLSQALNELYSNNYDLNKLFSDPSGNEFFSAIKTDLNNSNPTQIGVCDQISLATAEAASNAGMKSEVISTLKDNGGHAYPIVQFGNSLYILDQDSLYSINNSKNIAEAIRQYQSTVLDSMVFQNDIFNSKGKLEYIIIQPEGKQFLDFLGYKTSPQDLQKELTGKMEVSNTPHFNVNLGTQTESVGISDLYGLKLKAGILNFKYYNMTLPTFDIGFDRNFSIGNIEIIPNISAFLGNLGNHGADSPILGYSGDLGINTENRSGLNAGINISSNQTLIRSPLDPISNYSSLIFDIGASAGISYGFNLIGLKITPYALVQGAMLEKEASSQTLYPGLKSVYAGIDLNSWNKELSINPYAFIGWGYYGTGIRLEAGNKKVGGYLNGELKEPNKEAAANLAPRELSAKVGAHINLNNFTLKLNYNIDSEDYSGERSIQDSFNISSNIAVK